MGPCLRRSGGPLLIAKILGHGLPDGKRSGHYIVGRAEMGTDTAALRAKLLQLMRGQEAVQAFRNGLRFGV